MAQCRGGRRLGLQSQPGRVEPQLKAMFETSAEVLGGLEKAFKDYEKKNEST